MRLSTFSSMAAAFLLATSLFTAAPAEAWGQMRTLPANGKRATLAGYQNPFVVLGGEPHRLAPGAVIFDTNNRMILPGYLPASADVFYTTDKTGLVMRIYILTESEQQRLDQAGH